ncbi:MAG TPA: 3-oxoadipate enol-lactonase [Patescibacteria group bacterium]|nr:3-oxoadipate enol-lactonase [Patescibacteria group bacterium]
MSFLQVGDLRVHYSLTGLAEAPVVIFSNSLGTDFSMWDGQAAALEGRFRVLRYDTRGHGQTSVPAGPYSIEQLGGDVVGLLDSLGLERAYFCGLSQGGMIGMWLGLHAAGRFARLVLANTGARIGTVEMWNTRIDRMRREGLPAASAAIAERWLSADFRARSPRVVQEVRRMFERTPIEGYVACCEALRDADFRPSVSSIRLPTLVIAGTRDPAIPAADGRFLAAQIPGARYAELDTAHLSNLEAPEPFNGELIRFLTS